jgi:D-alanyl-lipoteichoic acid acyltransferase DltB (MBOAT superfamily)
MPIRFLDFWLPVGTISLTVFAWLLTADTDQKRDRGNLWTAIFMVGLVLLVAVARYAGLGEIITASRPPQINQVLVGVLILVLVSLALGRFAKPERAWLIGGMVVVLLIFLILKVPQFALWGSMTLRSLVDQSTATASPLDIRWLGFSYVAFRLMHTWLDRKSGRLEAYSLMDMVNYVIFFPSLSAGPIDRLPRFVKDAHKPIVILSPELGEAFYRLAVGIFKKFALADTLAMLALNPLNADQIQSTGWSWVLVYAYAFQIYFDFAGYTDIAIGVGQLMGITLPENFNRPYLKSNLTQFWNNWHMTLTQWFRAYFFNPFTRYLRKNYRHLSVGWIVLITQLSTMVLIGFWHGVTFNFLFWGLWHGLGLFINNRFSDWMKPRATALQDRPKFQKLLDGFNTFLTFNYVALGWVFFALPSLDLSWRVFGQLFGWTG